MTLDNTLQQTKKNGAILHSYNLNIQNTQNVDKYNEQIHEINNTYLEIQNLEKPLKAISNYKMNDLLNFSNKIGLTISEKIKKNELYQQIITYISPSLSA